MAPLGRPGRVTRARRLGPGLYRRRRRIMEVAGPTLFCLAATAVIIAATLLLTHLIVS